MVECFTEHARQAAAVATFELLAQHKSPRATTCTALMVSHLHAVYSLLQLASALVTRLKPVPSPQQVTLGPLLLSLDHWWVEPQACMHCRCSRGQTFTYINTLV